MHIDTPENYINADKCKRAYQQVNFNQALPNLQLFNRESLLSSCIKTCWNWSSSYHRLSRVNLSCQLYFVPAIFLEDYALILMMIKFIFLRLGLDYHLSSTTIYDSLWCAIPLKFPSRVGGTEPRPVIARQVQADQ